MNPRPSDEILLKYASGVLDPALHLLVGRHLDMSPSTQSLVTEFEEFGGQLLASEIETSMTAGSLDRALARISGEHPKAMPPLAWPPLDALGWRWAGPGRRLAKVDIPGSDLKAYAFRTAPGKAMLQHGHSGQEWTLIVQGAYRDETGEFRTGAFIEEDESTLHAPVAFGEVDCICLAVMSGPLVAQGMMGKIARWMM